jgi:hypothetical protein
MSADIILGFSLRKCSQCGFPVKAVWLKTPAGDLCAECAPRQRLTDLIEALAKSPPLTESRSAKSSGLGSKNEAN